MYSYVQTFVKTNEGPNVIIIRALVYVSHKPVVVWACVKAGLPDRPDHPDHQKCGGKKRMGWERVTARSQGSRQLDRL